MSIQSIPFNQLAATGITPGPTIVEVPVSDDLGQTSSNTSQINGSTINLCFRLDYPGTLDNPHATLCSIPLPYAPQVPIAQTFQATAGSIDTTITLLFQPSGAVRIITYNPSASTQNVSINLTYAVPHPN
jgi:hypothetical protein